MESKIEKLKKWLDEKPANWWGTSKTMSHIWGKVCMLVAEEQAESHPATLEPLACLAAKDGFSVKILPPTCLLDRWDMSLYKTKRGIYDSHNFREVTYAACEQLARTWLNNLEA